MSEILDENKLTKTIEQIYHKNKISMIFFFPFLVVVKKSSIKCKKIRKNIIKKGEKL